jgi:hypothetical protein
MFILLQVFVLVIFQFYSVVSTDGFIGLVACLLSGKHFDMKAAECGMIFFIQCHHMSLMDFVVSPPGCGRSVTDF